MSYDESHDLLQQAKNLHQQGEYFAAAELADLIIEKSEPTNEVYIQAVIQLALATRQQGKAESAIAIADRAISLAQEGCYEQLIAESYEIQGVCYRNLGQYEKALEFLQLALNIYDKLYLQSNVGRIASYIGATYADIGDFTEGLNHFIKALSINEELNDLSEISGTLDGIAGIYGELGFSDVSIEYYNKALLIAQNLQNKSLIARINGNIGITYFDAKLYDKALEHAYQALSISEEIGERRQVGFWLLTVGNALNEIGNKSEALEYYLRSLEVRENELNTTQGISETLHRIGEILLHQENYSEGIEKLEQALAVAIRNKERFDQYIIHKSLSMAYAQTNNYKAAFENFQKFHELEKQTQGEELKKQMEQFAAERKIAERDKQHAVERAKHEATEQLLHNVLPQSIVQQMIEGTRTIAKKLSNVSILFADIVNFTTLSQQITPDQLVEGLDAIFSEFDELAEKYGLEKIKTIGDAYMVVAGAPEPREDHAEAIAQMAIEMQLSMRKFRAISTHEEIQIRIGIHTGEVVAGVIGKKKFAYDLWGDAVNTASRMESHGEAGKIHVTEAFAEALFGSIPSLSVPSPITNPHVPITLEERGVLEIKGKGQLRTYFLSPIIA